MSKKLFALVKWIGGEDDKKYTEGIPLNWILGFDYEAYMADELDVSEPYVVEWRDTKKKPRGGWNCYDCHVVLVSDRIAKLKNHLKILEGVKTPKVVHIESSATNDQDLGTAQNRTVQKDISLVLSGNRSGDDTDEDYVTVQQKKAPKRHLDFDSDEDQEKIRNKAGPSKTGVIPRTKDSRRDSSEHNSQDQNVHSDVETVVLSPVESTNDETSSSLDTKYPNKQSNKPSNKEPTLSDIMAVLKQNESAIEKLESEFLTLKKGKSKDPPVRRPTCDRKSGQSYKNALDLDDGEFVEGNVEIGPPGSGIFVTDLQWTSAISKGTYKAMATTLITSLFSTDILLKSNFKGGESKLKKKINPCPQYEALDQKILRAVMYSVRAMYPKTFTEVGVGQAINVKLTNMRAKYSSMEERNDDTA